MRIAYDVIGNRNKAVAIMDSRPENGEKAAAKEIMERCPNVKSVLMKGSPREGVYRIYSLRLIAGDKDTEVVHREHGLIFKLDPQKVYFSPRESTERQKMAVMVKPRERVLVMFSGISPFGIAIAKHQPTAEVVCVEINKEAHDYAEQNVRLNRAYNVKNYCWDVRDATGLGKFDRILMPLPESAVNFLDVAFASAKRGAIIHLYGISREKGFRDLKSAVALAAKQCGKRIRIVSAHKVLPYAPFTVKARVDIKML
ncbi:MAG: methyltransferase [Candidatus Aenigmatarchaeota archaeon]